MCKLTAPNSLPMHGCRVIAGLSVTPQSLSCTAVHAINLLLSHGAVGLGVMCGSCRELSVTEFE
jgi:hypothetical protein